MPATSSASWWRSRRGHGCMDSRFKGLSDVALGEAKRLGCSYADIRFTRNITDSVAVRDRVVVDSFGFGGAGREESAGFGVRVIHSGVWGFASSPLVDRGRDQARWRRGPPTWPRPARWPRSSTSSCRRSRPTRTTGRRRSRPSPTRSRSTTRSPSCSRSTSSGLKQPDVIRIQSQMAFDFEWKYLATSEGSYIEQEIHRASPGFTVTARKNGKVKQRTFSVAPKSAGYEVILDAQDARERRADLRRGGRALHRAAGDGGAEGPGDHAGPRDADHPRDRRPPDRARSGGRLRGQLRRHQLHLAAPTSAR